MTALTVEETNAFFKELTKEYIERNGNKTVEISAELLIKVYGFLHSHVYLSDEGRPFKYPYFQYQGSKFAYQLLDEINKIEKPPQPLFGWSVDTIVNDEFDLSQRDDIEE